MTLVSFRCECNEDFRTNLYSLSRAISLASVTLYLSGSVILSLPIPPLCLSIS